MSDYGEFSGEPRSTWLTNLNGPDRNMQLLEKFEFADPSGNVWSVPETYDKLDGATIPRALWSLVGSPYVGNYRRASIVHDYAVHKSSKDDDRKAADKMFYFACRTGGCNWLQALMLYAGVRIGAWLDAEERYRDAASRIPHPPRFNVSRFEQDVLTLFQDVCQICVIESEHEDFEVAATRIDAEIGVRINSLG